MVQIKIIFAIFVALILGASIVPASAQTAPNRSIKTDANIVLEQAQLMQLLADSQAQAKLAQNQQVKSPTTSANDSGNSSNGPAGQGTGNWQNSAEDAAWNNFAAWAQSCQFCDVFEDIERVKNKWGIELFHIISPHIFSVFKSLIYLHIVLAGILLMMRTNELAARLQKLAMSLVMTVIVVIILNDQTGVPLPWVVIREIETSALKLGALIISNTADKPIPLNEAGGLYSALTGLVEQQVWKIVSIAKSILNGGGGGFGVAEAFQRAVTALIMMLPYLFVMGIFLAFMVEAMFKFVAISMLSPLLMPCLVFGWSRAYVFASLRLLLGAFLTIVFASMAMGLTVVIVDTKLDKIEYVRAQAASAMGNAKITAETFCADPRGIGGAIRGVIASNRQRTESAKRGEQSDKQFDIEAKQCEMVWADVSQIEDAKLQILGKEYFVIVIIGFMSVLLHLQSKSLASNISGAQDGAGPAAAVVGAAKVALGAGMMWGSKTVFGGGGQIGQAVRTVGGKMFGGGNGAPGGQGANASAANAMRSTETQSPMSMAALGGGTSSGAGSKGLGEGLGERAKGAQQTSGPDTKKGGFRE